ncbi:hypothetical protein QFZ56_004270 [Streptomyces achromogenes]|uniref:Uncharacterized protein n=1 Tax=Streptomyces achromogenes TaxID=67255 RepID=A0ABU0Q3R0_STRAH|nr:hypothetical protein [Streptomyces achromogenes]MDQ0685307.1 hypothetical protein [Streptomyces achromogenes]
MTALRTVPRPVVRTTDVPAAVVPATVARTAFAPTAAVRTTGTRITGTRASCGRPHGTGIRRPHGSVPAVDRHGGFAPGAMEGVPA